MRTATLLSAEDFAAVAPILGPCELVKGEIVPMSPGGLRHSRVTGNAFALIDAHCRSRNMGRALTGEAGVIVARRPDTVRGADVAYVSYQRLPDEGLGDGFLAVPPELVIEVLSKDTSWAKVEEEIADYHEFGVDLVWVLDPQTLTLRTYPRSAPSEIFQGDDLITADPHVPGFSTRTSAFFAR
jgi:Uma2 family endonuclease